MKKYALSLAILALAVSFFLSQQSTETKADSRPDQVSQPFSAQAAAFAVSRPVRELAHPESVMSTPPADLQVRDIGANSSLFGNSANRHDSDESLAEFGTTPMPPPTVSVPGLADIDNAMIFSLLIIPPDMNGDVGPNHYDQIVISLFRLLGTPGQPMSPPFKISSLFESLGTVCSPRNDGLAIVQYDPLADRWLVSQTRTAVPPFMGMLAISKTGDPLGQYYAYEFVMPNVKLNDFPKFGVWPDAYYMSTDEF